MRIYKLRTPHISDEGRIFSWTSLINSFGLGLLLPIFPTFVESIINSEVLVGYFYSAMSVSMILAGFASAYLYRRYPRITVLNASFIFAAILTMFFVFVNTFFPLFVLDFARMFISILIMMSLALMVHDFAKANSLGRTEGFYFLFNNIGYFMGPIVGGIVARYAGLEPVFVLSGLCFLGALSYLLHQHLVKKHPSLSLPHSKGGKVGLESLKLFLKNRQRIGAYFVSVSLISWMSFKQIVIPLFAIGMGYGADTAGLIISLSILPCIFFELPIGKYADRMGVKLPIAIGFFIIAFFVLAVRVSPFFILDAIFLVAANVGGSFIEPLHDVYFFKNVKKDEEDDLFGVFATADPLGRFIGPAIISTTLLFFPFEGVFIVFAGLFAVAGTLSFFIKD